MFLRRWLKALTWSVDNDAGVAAFRAGRFERAASLFSAIPPAGPRLVITLNNLAAANFAGERYAEAEALYRRLESVWEPLVVSRREYDERLGIEFVLNNLAMVCAAQGRYDEAEAILDRAMRETSLWKPYPDLAESLELCARIDLIRGRLDAAELRAGWALAMHEQTLGRNHPDISMKLGVLEAIRRAQNRVQAADALRERARKLRSALGPADADPPTRKWPRPGLWDAEGGWVETDSACLRAAAMRRSATESRAVEFAAVLEARATLNRATSVHRWMDDSVADQQARSFYKRALRVRQRTVGLEHPSLADTMQRLALTEQSLQPVHLKFSIDVAGGPLRKAMEMTERGLGPAHPALAPLLVRLAQYRLSSAHHESADLLRRALSIQESALGPAADALQPTLMAAADVFSQWVGNHEEAERLYSRSIGITESGFGAYHPAIASALDGLSWLYHRERRWTEAAACDSRLISMAERLLGQENAFVTERRAQLSTILN